MELLTQIDAINYSWVCVGVSDTYYMLAWVHLTCMWLYSTNTLHGIVCLFSLISTLQQSAHTRSAISRRLKASTSWMKKCHPAETHRLLTPTAPVRRHRNRHHTPPATYYYYSLPGLSINLLLTQTLHAAAISHIIIWWQRYLSIDWCLVNWGCQFTHMYKEVFGRKK